MQEHRRLSSALVGGALLLIVLWPATTSSPAPVAPPPLPSAATLDMLAELSRWAADRDRGFDLFGHRHLFAFAGARRGFALFADSPERRLLDRVPYGAYIVEAADRYRIDSLLLASVVEAESGFDAGAVSPQGAQGLMQLMPTTAASYGAPEVADPRANVRAGARYLRYLLGCFDDDLELALAAYNAGPAAVRKHGGIPPYRETRAYVERVLANYVRLHRQLWQDTEMEALLGDALPAPPGATPQGVALTPLQRSGLVGSFVLAAGGRGGGVFVATQPLAEVADALSQPLTELRQPRRAEQQHDDGENDEQLRDAEIGHEDLPGGLLAKGSGAPPARVSLAGRPAAPSSPNGEPGLPEVAPGPRQSIARRGRGSV
jgi:hypothetical protein